MRQPHLSTFKHASQPHRSTKGTFTPPNPLSTHQPPTHHILLNKFTKMSARRGVPSATLIHLPTEVQHSIFASLAPTQITSLAALTRSTTKVIADPHFWRVVSLHNLGTVPDEPSAKSVRKLADSLVCRWWLLTGLFVAGVPVHRRSGFCQVAVRGGVELPIVHPEKESCYVFGGQHEAAAIPVMNPSVSLCFYLDPAGPFPVNGMRLALVHTVEVPERDSDPNLSDLDLGPAAIENFMQPLVDPFASVTVRVNNKRLLHSFRPESGNFQVTHIQVPPDLLVTKPRMNHISVEYDRDSTAAYWLKDVSIMPSILPLPVEESLVTGIRIGEPLPQPQPVRPVVSHPPSPRSRPQDQSHGHPNNHGSHHHRRPVHRLTNHSLKLHITEAPPAPRHQKGYHVNIKPRHMYHHNFFRSPRRSSPNSPKARSAR